ncbi:ABC transporter substrate-binding protein, partial [Thermodesulfobacteriota bacterium]
AKIPHIAPITASTGIVIPPKRYVFGFFSLRTDIGKVFIDYAVNDLRFKGKKMAYIGIDDSYGKDFYTGINEQATNYGIKLVAVEWYKRGAVDLSTNILNLKKAGAEVVYMAALMNHAALIIKEAAKLGWKPQFMMESGGANVKMIELAGRENCEGIISNKSYPLIKGSKEEGIRIFKRDLKKYYPKVPADAFSISGYMVAHVAELALKETGRNLTREGLVETLESWKDKDTGFIPLTYGKNYRVGSNSIFFTVVKDGEFKQISGWRVPKKF